MEAVIVLKGEVIVIMDWNEIKSSIFERLGPQGIEALIKELEPNTHTHNNYMILKCPQCGQREAYLYYNAHNPRIKCNRLRNCCYSHSLVDYLMERDNKPYKEIMADLAKLAGIEITNETLEGWEHEKNTEEALEEINRFFVSTLYSEDGKETLAYLHNRGYTDEEIQAMGLGAFPGKGKTLKYIEQDLKATQEAKERLKGKYFKYAFLESGARDHYKLVFPYRGAYGEIRAFIGRLISSDQQGDKYKPLGDYAGVQAGAPFGLYDVRGEEVILVEGYLDALLAKAKGINNVVALTNARLLEGQVEALIRRGITRVILALDNDEAGAKGTEDIIKKLMPYDNITSFVATFREAKDPDELIKNHGIEAFKKAIHTAKESWRGVTWLADRITRKYAPYTQEGRDRILKELQALSNNTNNPLDIEAIKDCLATALDLPRDDVDSYIESYKEKEQSKALALELQRGLDYAKNLLQSGPPQECLAFIEGVLERSHLKARREEARLAFPPFNEGQFIEALAKEKKGLPTGYEDLDTQIALPLGAITLIAGRPGHGKTTFLLNLLRKQIEIAPQKRYVFATYEENERRIILKLLVSMANRCLGYSDIDILTNYKKMLLGENLDMPIDDKEHVKETWDKLRGLLEDRRLIIQYRPGNVKELAQAILGLKDTYGDELGAVFIDYMQILPLPDDMKNNGAAYQRVQSISALIRNMAVETGLPVIAGAQLNRQATNKPGNKNSVTSILRPEFLREAGDLEQDANLILGIYNRTAGLLEQDGESITGTSDFVVVALKNREGPINGTPIELTYNRPLWRIDG